MNQKPSAGMIRVRELFKTYPGHPVLRGLELEVAQGEVIVLIGPSGSGKTTLLRCLNALESFEGGQILIDGLVLEPAVFRSRHSSQIIRSVRLRVGMVFQSFQLFPHLTVLQNLTLAPMKVLGLSREQAQEEARTWLRRVNLTHKETQYPSALSGGEQQRVAIARTLVMRPQAVLLDEPTSNLDPELVGEVLAVIADLATEGYTMLIVSHQMHFARRCAHRMLFLNQGKIEEEGPPEQLLDAPQSPAARQFLRNLHG